MSDFIIGNSEDVAFEVSVVMPPQSRPATLDRSVSLLTCFRMCVES